MIEQLREGDIVIVARLDANCRRTYQEMREYQVRICERLGVKFPGPTRRATMPLRG
jgi:hypothetical protein